jgi:hypothetical protein
MLNRLRTIHRIERSFLERELDCIVVQQGVHMLVFATAIFAMAFGFFTAPVHATQGLAPLQQNRGGATITNDQGFPGYLVEMTRDATDAFPDETSPELAARFQPWNTGKAKNLVASFEDRYAFSATDMTNWVGNSFTAYLSPEQLRAVRQDPLVVMVTELAQLTLSYPWYDTAGTELIPWGRNAVNGKASNSSVRVYVIDLGVGYHEDLNNVISRVNASCNASGSGSHSICSSLESVGCYPHSTHIAGIISASYGNAKGSAGVDAGAAIISVSVSTANANGPGSPPSATNCALTDNDPSSIASAMDYTMWDLILHGGSKVGIVNISINTFLGFPNAWGPGNTLNNMMVTLATPYIGNYVYAGAFIVQSAGNDYTDACLVAFGDPTSHVANSSDGIMVVGAIDYQAQPLGPFSNTYAGGGSGSNYGGCVDVWAPGKLVYSTWGPLVGYSPGNPATYQFDDSTTPYTNYNYLTGTSLAAPHIAGIAAYLAEQSTYGTPAAIETAIRGLFYNAGQYDHAGLLMNMVALAPNPVLVGAVSSKVHGAAGTFDLALWTIPTNPTTEPRQSSSASIVMTFDEAIISATATITEGTATAGTLTFSGNSVTVPLTSVSDQQYVTISLTSVASAAHSGGTGSIRIGFLTGDVNQSRAVTVGDVGLINAQLAQTVTSSNYLEDVNASGTITLADKGIANSALTHSLPAP